jgi:hypothetical protein
VALAVLALAIRWSLVSRVPDEPVRKELPAASSGNLQEMEEAVEANPEDSVLTQKAVETYRAAAGRSQSASERIAYLSKAIRLKSEDPGVRRGLSRAYADTARKVYAPEMRIRFYLMATSFNRYNEEAWDQLVQVYEEAGEAEKAGQAKQKRDDLFSERNSRVEEIVSPYGDLAKAPYCRDDVFYVEYRSRESLQRKIEMQIFAIAGQLRELSGSAAASIKALWKGKEGVEVVSSLEETPDRFETWRKKVKVNRIQENSKYQIRNSKQ